MTALTHTCDTQQKRYEGRLGRMRGEREEGLEASEVGVTDYGRHFIIVT